MLVLPVIGGYFLATYGRRLRYYHEYQPPQRLLFHAIAIGAVTPTVVGTLIGGLEWVVGRYAEVALPSFGMTETPSLALSCVVSFALLATAAYRTRVRGGDERKGLEPELVEAIDSVGDEADVLLKDAYVRRSLLLVTLGSRKVYVAYVLSTPSPRRTRHVSIRPVFSGYRDECLEVHLTTVYPSIDFDLPDPYEVVVELADVTSFAKWELRIYEDQFARKKVAPPGLEPGSSV